MLGCFHSIVHLVTIEVFKERKNEVHRLLLFSGVAGPAGRRHPGFCIQIEDEDEDNGNPLRPILIGIHAIHS